MARQDAVHDRSPGRVGRAWVAVLPLLLIAVLSLAGGVDAFVQHFGSSESRPYRSSCGLVLIAAGLAQLALVRRQVVGGRTTRARIGAPHFKLREAPRPSRRVLLELSILAMAASFALALVFGPDASARYVFRAACATSFTGIVWAWAASPAGLARLEARPGLRRALHAAAGCVVALVVAEVALRGNEHFAPSSQSPIRAVVSPVWADATGVAGLADMPGVAPELTRMQPHTAMRSTRVALVGNAHWMREALGDLDADLMRCVPGVEVHVIDSGSGHAPSPQSAHDLAAVGADIVLVLLPAAGVADPRTSAPGVFDWRGLRLFGWIRASTANDAPARPSDPTAIDASSSPASYENYLNTCAFRLAAFRTPECSRVARAWDELRSAVDNFARHDSTRQMALVVVPEELQLNAALRAALLRRAGCRPGDCDLDLPQRRLTGIAQRAGADLLDLRMCLAEEPGCFDRSVLGRLGLRGRKLVAQYLADWIAHVAPDDRFVATSPTR